MCSSPNIPAPPPPPPPPQEVKQPAVSNERSRRNRTAGAMGGGSLLTGPSGVAAGSLTTGRASLLGQ